MNLRLLLNNSTPYSPALAGLIFFKERVMDLIRIIFSVLIPPLGVFLQVGLGAQFWINIILTLLGYIPGLIHAVYIIGKR
jgi:uncharacterized membrane protein YqaE (UPF0057 family)